MFLNNMLEMLFTDFSILGTNWLPTVEDEDSAT